MDKITRDLPAVKYAIDDDIEEGVISTKNGDRKQVSVTQEGSPAEQVYAEQVFKSPLERPKVSFSATHLMSGLRSWLPSLGFFTAKVPSAAKTMEEFKSCLDVYVTREIMKDQTQADFLHEAMGSGDFESHLETIMLDLNRGITIALNCRTFSQEDSQDDIRKHILQVGKKDNRIVALLNQGAFATITSKVATDEIWNDTVKIGVFDTSLEEDEMAAFCGLEKKIDVMIQENGEITSSITHLIRLKSMTADSEVFQYLSAEGGYSNGRTTASFKKIDIFTF